MSVCVCERARKGISTRDLRAAALMRVKAKFTVKLTVCESLRQLHPANHDSDKWGGSHTDFDSHEWSCSHTLTLTRTSGAALTH